MAKRGARAGPRRTGDNSLTAKEESALIKAMMDAMKDHKLRTEAFRAKMKKRWESEVVAIAKELNMAMADVRAEFEDFEIETGTDERAVQIATNKRARRLDTARRIYAALHDGEQLDFLKIQEQAETARKEAEAEASSGEVEEDNE